MSGLYPWIDAPQFTEKGGTITNFPNPFRQETNIYFNLEKESQVSISVFTLQGKLIETIFDGKLGRGTQYQTWTPRNQERGIYLYKIQTDDQTDSGKMVYLN